MKLKHFAALASIYAMGVPGMAFAQSSTSIDSASIEVPLMATVPPAVFFAELDGSPLKIDQPKIIGYDSVNKSFEELSIPVRIMANGGSVKVRLEKNVELESSESKQSFTVAFNDHALTEGQDVEVAESEHANDAALKLTPVAIGDGNYLKPGTYTGTLGITLTSSAA